MDNEDDPLARGKTNKRGKKSKTEKLVIKEADIRYAKYWNIHIVPRVYHKLFGDRATTIFLKHVSYPFNSVR